MFGRETHEFWGSYRDRPVYLNTLRQVWTLVVAPPFCTNPNIALRGWVIALWDG